MVIFSCWFFAEENESAKKQIEYFNVCMIHGPVWIHEIT